MFTPTSCRPVQTCFHSQRPFDTLEGSLSYIPLYVSLALKVFTNLCSHHQTVRHYVMKAKGTMLLLSLKATTLRRISLKLPTPLLICNHAFLTPTSLHLSVHLYIDKCIFLGFQIRPRKLVFQFYFQDRKQTFYPSSTF